MPSELTEPTELWNGFMPPNPPITPLPSEWELWETLLEAAMDEGLQLGGKLGITEEEKQTFEREYPTRMKTYVTLQLPVIAAS
ncbi:hypothetical protein MPER_00574 [Moniliophthora perniciosa FA553]|nr:hypothetical protein MPER_00574 [Moniliophthora perniciosa FA553]